MVSAFTCLYLLSIICACVKLNEAETKVFYEFHIREAHSERNETIALRTNRTDDEPELIITGSRSSARILPGRDENSTNNVYKEHVVYTGDNNGYHAKYNISIEPLDIGTRLNGKTLMSSVG
ncbi:uncharacterized protein LOC108602913 [Drosophila busckii]|uniref:uncharacterized protein LOC108602913 n=1 Tax=Drosophila busckii TaxID=30019 RepID=UPI00083E974B|nr:uncharacterized protein LOC108602913 [Drosophila busckii]